MHDTTTTGPVAPAGRLARTLLAAGAAVAAASVLRSGPGADDPATALAALEGQVVVLALGALGPPLLYAGIVLLLHQRARQLVPTTWCDGPVLVVLLSATAGAVVVPWFRAVTGAGSALAWVLVERTLVDLLVASLAVGACAVVGRSADRRLPVLAAATTTVAVVDLVEVVHLTGALGGSLGWAAGWSRVVVLLLALGAVAAVGARPVSTGVEPDERPLVGGGTTLLGPALSLGLVAALFALVALRGVSAAVLVLTALGLAGVGVRIALVLQELVRVTALAAAVPTGTPGAGSGRPDAEPSDGGPSESGRSESGRSDVQPPPGGRPATGVAALLAPATPGGAPRLAAPLFRRRTEDAPGAAGGGVVVGHRALSQQLARAAASGRAVHLVVLDLHGVDTLEERLGGGAVARLVLRTGQLLLAAAGPEALVARTGAAEHTVLVPGHVVASGLAHRLVAAVGATAAGHDPEGGLVVGAGVASRLFEPASPPAAGEELHRRAVAAARAGRVTGGGVTVDGHRTATRPPGRPAGRRAVAARAEAPEPWLLELRARREAVTASTTADGAW